jgi:heterodisulfide reductase subunit B
METVKPSIGVFPGCSLEGSAGAFQTSLESVLRELGVAWQPLRDWNCCGATSAHAVDHTLHLALNLRNLAQAEAQGCKDLLAPCAACYHRLACSAIELDRTPERLKDMNRETGLNYGGSVAVRNVLDFLAHDVGIKAISARVRNPLTAFKVVSYYGCLNTRVPHGQPFDDQENPISMDRIVEALGAQALDWSYKTECCGASLFVTSEAVSAKLVARILKDAVARGADCIAVACPMCQNNLDTKQEKIRRQFGISRQMPAVFVTQLMGLAFGLSESQLKLHHGFTQLPCVVGPKT